MKRQVSPILAAILVGADLVALWGAFEATAALRIALNRLLPLEFTRELVLAVSPPMPVVAACWIATLAWTGAYDLLGKRSIAQVAGATARAVTLAMCLQVVVLFFLTRSTYSRSLILIYWAVSLVFLTTSREIAFFLLRRLKARGLAAEPVAVIGTGPLGRVLAAKIAADREPRFRFVGYVADDDSTTDEAAALALPVLGHVDKLEGVINGHGLRRLFVATPGMSTDKSMGLLALCDRMGVRIERVPDTFGLYALRMHMTEIDGLPLLSFRPRRITRWDQAVKRTVDVLVSALGLTLLAPLYLALMTAIRVESRGPVLFRQPRVGRGGTHFLLLKFRSMHAGSEQIRPQLATRNEASGHLFKIRNDPRVTRVGRLLRRWSLDELPQLWNVLVGDMSLVGPRPLPAVDVDVPESPFTEWGQYRASVRPGITGLWQVSGRSQLSFDEMVRLDRYYIDNWSLGLDLSLLLRTIPAVLRGEGAY